MNRLTPGCNTTWFTLQYFSKLITLFNSYADVQNTYSIAKSLWTPDKSHVFFKYLISDLVPFCGYNNLHATSKALHWNLECECMDMHIQIQVH